MFGASPMYPATASAAQVFWRYSSVMRLPATTMTGRYFPLPFGRARKPSISSFPLRNVTGP